MSDDAQAYGKPLPEPNAISKPYWDAARERRLVLQRSGKTGRYVFYPRAVSPYGADDTLEWVEASGRGTVYSYTVARRATAPQWSGEEPYVIAIVALDEGGFAVEVHDVDLRIGLPVEVAFVDVTPEVTLVQWRPRSAGYESGDQTS